MPFRLLTAVTEPLLLALSLVIVVVETLVVAITMRLPLIVIDQFQAAARSIVRMFPAPGRAELLKDRSLLAHVKALIEADDFISICNVYGYDAEEHVVPTADGYLLGVHRIGGRQGERWRGQSSTAHKPIVYLHHGLMMNSEVWVASSTRKGSIAFALAELGFDVWLGNNRGNKYSRKHVSLSPHSEDFWNFGLDEFALYDIPDTIKYVLKSTGQKHLSYVGFSQGSAQGFASFAIHSELSQSVNAFVALAPAMAPPGVHPMVQAIMNASPSALYSLFGRRIILRSAAFWQSIVYPPLFVKVIDRALLWLFNWKSSNISYPQKLVGYNHLYSYTSVKSVVHWFQIIRSHSFQMYDDDSMNPFRLKTFSRVHRYPTKNIQIPIGVVYGTTDSLLDISALISELPDTTLISGVPGYEHLDMIWGKRVEDDIVPRIVSCLERCVEQATRRRNIMQGESTFELEVVGRHQATSPSDNSRLAVKCKRAVEYEARNDSTVLERQLHTPESGVGTNALSAPDKDCECLDEDVYLEENVVSEIPAVTQLLI